MGFEKNLKNPPGIAPRGMMILLDRIKDYS